MIMHSGLHFIISIMAMDLDLLESNMIILIKMEYLHHFTSPIVKSAMAAMVGNIGTGDSYMSMIPWSRLEADIMKKNAYVILSSTENIANKLDTIHKKIMYPVEVVVLNPNGIIN